MFHVSAFSESVADDGTLQAIATVNDAMVTTTGDDLRIPTGLDKLIGEIACVATEVGGVRARIVSPSLRSFLNMEIAPVINLEGPGALGELQHIHPRNPIQLKVGESLNYESDGGGDGVTNEDVSALVFLSPHALVPVEGDFRTVRATTVDTSTQRVWSPMNLTLTEDLPAGRYAVVGARFEGANILGGRLVFTQGGPRPGTVGVNGVAAGDMPGSRFGGWGIWGSFDINQPPTVEILSTGGTDATPDVFLDLMELP